MANNTVANSSANNGFENLLIKEDIESVVRKSLGSKYNILNYYTESYSSENLGLMGVHKNLIIEVSRDGSKTKETHTYFFKTIPLDIPFRAKFLKSSGLLDKEMCFYNSIMPELMKSSKDKSWAAQCYLAKEKALVFENLKLKNYTLKGKTLDVESLGFALSSLAKIHSASLLAEKRLGKTFIEMYPTQLKEILFTPDGPFGEWYKSGVIITTKVAEKLGLNYKVVPKMYDLFLEKTLPSKTRRSVINHGDTWSNNIMFNGSKCAFVDFQTTRYVSAMFDVAQLIYFNAERQVREKYEVKLIDYYYKSMCEALRDEGIDIPSFEDVLEGYKEMKIVGIATISLYIPVQQIGEQKMNEMLNNSNGFEDLFCKDRLNLSLETMEKDERYREAVTSVIREFLDFSKTLFK